MIDGPVNADAKIMTIMASESEGEGGNVDPISTADKAEYCRYVVVTAGGSDCGRFQRNFVVCVNCPDSGKCPGVKPDALSEYQLVDADGNVLCKGTWVRTSSPNGEGTCMNCNGGKTGFVFVD